MNIAVIGVGGVGGYYGGKLTQLISKQRALNVYFVARNEHLREIQHNGLLLETSEGTFVCAPTLATDDISELPMLDLVLICVKGYDLDGVVQKLKTRVTEATCILPLLNGIDIYDRIKKQLPHVKVLPACVYISMAIEQPGKVVQSGAANMLHFGEDPQSRGSLWWLSDLFAQATIKFNYTDKPLVEIWSKFVFIASFGLVTAYFDANFGQVLSSPDMTTTLRSIMGEIFQLSKAAGIALPPTVVEESIEKGRKFAPETRTSFQRDFALPNKKDERELFGGVIVELGKRFNVDVSTAEAVYSQLNQRKKSL